MAILPIPSGTRDILPDEMRELSSIVGALKGVFADAGFGEITTPALEYEEVLSRADIGARPAYRVVDDHGAVLVLRSDMTVPIARVVATRYATSDPPLRFCYVAPVYRAVRPHRGMSREFLQAGIELVGLPSAGRDRRGAHRAVPGAGGDRAAQSSASASVTLRCSRGCSTRPASTAPHASA